MHPLYKHLFAMARGQIRHGDGSTATGVDHGDGVSGSLGVIPMNH